MSEPTRRAWCPHPHVYARGACAWPLCGCPDDPLTADDIKLQIKILCNTIASGEAKEDECYRYIGKLVKRLEAVS